MDSGFFIDLISSILIVAVTTLGAWGTFINRRLYAVEDRSSHKSVSEVCEKVFDTKIEAIKADIAHTTNDIEQINDNLKEIKDDIKELLKSSN